MLPRREVLWVRWGVQSELLDGGEGMDLLLAVCEVVRAGRGVFFGVIEARKFLIDPLSEVFHQQGPLHALRVHAGQLEEIGLVHAVPRDGVVGHHSDVHEPQRLFPRAPWPLVLLPLSLSHLRHVLRDL